MRKLSGHKRWIIPFLLWAAASGPARPQTGSIGIDVASQYRLYLKVLAFDRHFMAGVGDTLIIGVLFAAAVPESRRTVDDFARAVEAGPVEFEGRPVRVVPIKYGKQAQIEAALVDGGIDVLYVTPVGPFDLDPVSAACRSRRVVTFTGTPEYVERGLSVSFAMKGRRAEVIIDLGNSRAEGSDFSARLLNMVTVVGGARRGGTP